MSILEKLSMENLKTVADDHITMFSNRIASGHPNVITSECLAYLTTWRNIKKKVEDNCSLNQFTPEEAGEIHDALMSGEYDHLWDTSATESSSPRSTD